MEHSVKGINSTLDRKFVIILFDLKPTKDIDNVGYSSISLRGSRFLTPKSGYSKSKTLLKKFMLAFD